MTPGLADELARWLTLPGEGMAVPALAMCLWIVWRRRHRLVAIADAPSTVLAVSLAVPGLACLTWGLRAGLVDWLLAAGSLSLLAAGAAARGARGLRCLLVPAVVLALGARIPAPLGEEWIWRLQLWTARDAAWCLDRLAAFGWLDGSMSRSGVLLWSDRVTFHVIEGCSGLRGIRILLLAAFAIRELFPLRRRTGLLVLAAPVLGYALNVGRVAWIVLQSPTGPSAEARTDPHLVPGLAALAVGGVLLYAAGLWLSYGKPGDGSGAPPEPAGPSRDLRGLLALAAAALVTTAIALLVGAAPSRDAAPPEAVDLPMAAGDWTGEPLSPHGQDKFHFGALPWHRVVHRRYLSSYAPDRTVDVLIVPDLPDVPDTRKHFSSRLRTPGVDYEVLEVQPRRIWRLQLEAEECLLSRGGSHAPAALAYTWRDRDRGLLRESLDAWIAAPARAEPRVAVRLLTPLRDGSPLDRDRARKTLDQFVEAFAKPLEAIRSGG